MCTCIGALPQILSTNSLSTLPRFRTYTLATELYQSPPRMSDGIHIAAKELTDIIAKKTALREREVDATNDVDIRNFSITFATADKISSVNGCYFYVIV